MLETIEDCKAVQRKRAVHAKRGYSKHVRQWVKEQCTIEVGPTRKFTDWETYKSMLNQLPVYWGPKHDTNQLSGSQSVRRNDRVLRSGRARPFANLNQ